MAVRVDGLQAQGVVDLGLRPAGRSRLRLADDVIYFGRDCRAALGLAVAALAEVSVSLEHANACIIPRGTVSAGML